MKEILLSIITVCYNSEKTVEKTVRSIVGQMTDETEYIVVDGGSRDQTLEIIKRESGEQKINLISEPDRGIYDAMNKGISMARGVWLLFINSDDCLKSGIINKMLPELKRYRNYGCICTDVQMIRLVGEKRYSKIWRCEEPSLRLKKYMLSSHQGMYLNRERVEKTGRFDTDFPIVADWDLFYRIYITGCPIKCIHEITSEVLEGGASSHQVVWEKHRVRKKNHMYWGVDFGFFVDAGKRIKAELATLLLGNKKALLVAKRKYTEN